MAPKRQAAKQEELPLSPVLAALVANFETALERITALEAKVFAPKEKATIQKTEAFNGELPPEIREETSGLKMNRGDQIRSAINAVKILPPNLIKNGRHLKENVQAICGFTVDEEMMDEVYSNFSHSD